MFNVCQDIVRTKLLLSSNKLSVVLLNISCSITSESADGINRHLFRAPIGACPPSRYSPLKHYSLPTSIQRTKVSLSRPQRQYTKQLIFEPDSALQPEFACRASRAGFGLTTRIRAKRSNSTPRPFSGPSSRIRPYNPDSGEAIIHRIQHNQIVDTDLL